MTWNSVVTKLESTAPKLSDPALSKTTITRTASKLPPMGTLNPTTRITKVMTDWAIERTRYARM